MANMEHHVHVNGKTMSLGELMKSHEAMTNCMNALASHYMKMNADLDMGEKKAKSDEEGADKTERNALDGGDKDAQKAEKTEDKTARNSKQPADDILEFALGVGAISKEAPDYMAIMRNAKAKESEPSDKEDEGYKPSGTELGRQRYGGKR